MKVEYTKILTLYLINDTIPSEGKVIRLLYQEEIESYFDPAHHMSGRAGRNKNYFVSLVDRANGIRKRAGASTAEELQYFKDESIITLYTFISIDKINKSSIGKEVWGNIFSKAFRDKRTVSELNTLLENSGRMALETPLPPPQEIKGKIIQWVKSNPHPIKYIRDKFEASRVEDPTMADVTMILGGGNPNGPNASAMVCFECKFMSDISPETKYHFARNQIARNIDVGSILYPDGFYFILVTPSIFKDGGSRLYSYKMQNYQCGNVQTLKQDLLFGSDLADEEIAKISRRIGWVTWEDLVEMIFNYEGSSSLLPFEELKQFYAERCLLKGRSYNNQGPV